MPVVPVTEPYRLIVGRGSESVEHTAESLLKLAELVWKICAIPGGRYRYAHERGDAYGFHLDRGTLRWFVKFWTDEPLPRWARAETPQGKTMDVRALHAWGERLRTRSSWVVRRTRPDWNGEGPVPGIRKSRGGGYGYHRKLHTTAERRWAFKTEDGDPGPRGARNFKNIPNTWDDYPRTVERNWKSQHKGRKAWDR